MKIKLRIDSQITIEIEEAGLKTIQVTDNGEGIDHEDVPHALRSRHPAQPAKFRAGRLPSLSQW